MSKNRGYEWIKRVKSRKTVEEAEAELTYIMRVFYSR